MRIGILTGGGDVPGLNPCIKAVVNRVVHDGHEVIGLRRGWAALLEYDPDRPESPRTGSSRSTLAPFGRSTARRDDPAHLAHEPRPRPGGGRAAVPGRPLRGRGPIRLHRPRAASDRDRGLDVLIPIGGDDTLSYALRLHDEGVPVVAIPKTMDNDVHGTDYCIGFSTAVTRGVQFIHNLRTSTGSHERIAVVELFGRYSGETSLITAYLARVDRAVISEPCQIDRLSALLVADKRDNPSNYAMVTVSEGATIEGGELVLSGGRRVRPPQARRRRRAAGRAAPERTGEGSSTSRSPT